MATDPRPQSSTSFRGGGALGGGENLLDFEEGKKAAAKAEFFTVPPESSFLGGATYRDKIRGALRYLGLDNRALNYVVGDSRADNLVDNVGLFDLTPFAIPLAVQEGSRSMDQGRYLEGTLDLGFSALEMAPGAKLLTVPAKSFFKSLASKVKGSADNLGALENITKDIPQENISKNIWEETGYPSNMKEEDKSFVIQRMMELGNDPANPYLSGETGMQMLFKEKYGVSK
tara:strand:- start:144 stop:833 length:690 start_codon:yes stop_codon:yes gene_type:complete